MASTLNRQTPKPTTWMAAMITLGIVVLLGWILRYQATMRTDLIPGINGAYYLVQARAILQTGSLGIPDFPLLFYVEAALAGLLSIFTGQEAAIMTVVRWTDTLFPVLLAAPVCLLALSFPRTGKSQFTPALATFLVGLIAVGNTSLLRMAGDFQKNAAALPLSLTFVYFLYQSLSRQRKRDYVLAGVFFVLTCLTHLGVAALTLTITGLMAAINLISHPNRKRSLIIAIGLMLTMCLSLSIAYFYDPVRINRLLGIVLSPSELFANSALSRMLQSGQGRGGPPIENASLILGNILGLIGTAIAITHHKTARPAERTLLWAASLTALFFASPLIGGQWSQRLSLMSFLPGLIPITYLTVRRKWGWVLVLPVTIWVLTVTFKTPQIKAQRALSVDAYLELVSYKDLLPDGEILIVAPHGVEWWVSWTMQTDITNRVSLATENWDDYDHIFVVEESRGTLQGPNGQPLSGDKIPGSVPSSKPPQPGQRQNSSKPQPQGTAGGFNLGLNTKDTSLVHQGKFFTLREMTTKPIVFQGSGPPDLTGTLDQIIENEVIIDGTRVYLQDKTVYSLNGQEIHASDLITGEIVTVWGDWSLLSNTLTADFVMIGVRPSSGNPGGAGKGVMPPSGAQKDSVELGDLAMVTRSGWGAIPLNMEAENERGPFNPQTNQSGVLFYPQPVSNWLTTIVVHHSALPVSDGPKEIQQLHLNQRGYADIAYHFIIGRDGTLYEGRRINIRGAHVEGFNTGTIGVVLVGNMDVIEPSGEQLSTLEKLVDYLRVTYDITHLAGHQDFNPTLTECPGEMLHVLLPNLAQAHNLIFGTDGYTAPPWSGNP